MSLTVAAAKLAGAGAAGAAAATLGQVLLPADPSLWSVTILGIPLGVLAASLAGSSARALRDPSQDDRKILHRALNTLIDGFIGGWVAMFLYAFSYTKSYFSGMEPAILGAFGGLLTEYLRSNGPRWAEQAWTAALSLISRKRSGDSTP